MNYEIEKGVPIPSNQGNTKYPFKHMQVGDSVWIAGMTRSALANVLSHYKRKGLKFVTRTEAKDGAQGCRVWRTE